MIGADELAFEALAGLAIDHVAIDLSVTVDHAVLSREKLVLGMNVEGVWLMLRSA